MTRRRFSSVSDGAIVPSQRTMWLLPLGVAAGVLAGATLNSAFGAEGWRALTIIVSSWIGAAAASYVIVYRRTHDCIVTKALRRRQALRMIFPLLVIPLLLLGYLIVVVPEYAEGEAWAHAWVAITRPVANMVAWVILEMAEYPALLVELGHGDRTDIIMHAFAVSWLVQIPVCAWVFTAPTQFWWDSELKITPLTKLKRLTAGVFLILLFAAGVYWTIGYAEFFTGDNPRRGANTSHRNDGALIYNSVIQPTGGTLLWWAQAVFVLNLLRIAAASNKSKSVYLPESTE